LAARLLMWCSAVHGTLGLGLVESVYGQCFASEREVREILFQRQAALSVLFRNKRIWMGYRMDRVGADECIKTQCLLRIQAGLLGERPAVRVEAAATADRSRQYRGNQTPRHRRPAGVPNGSAA
jgi:hypothetical protein